jgi:hypothetical protein
VAPLFQRHGLEDPIPQEGSFSETPHPVWSVD